MKPLLAAYAGLSNLPHSRHDIFRRDVISPQNGHILCDEKSRRFPPNKFLNESVRMTNAGCARTNNRFMTGSMAETPLFLIGHSIVSYLWSKDSDILRRHDDTSGPVILYKIARMKAELSDRTLAHG
jgi:hypothetical protein